METLKYKVITSRKQYNEYCDKLIELLEVKPKNKAINEEIDLLTVLIEKWDNEHTSYRELKPVEILKILMEENNLTSSGLAKILGISKGMVSEILNYRKGLSKNNIRTLASHFKLSQEAFNSDYKLSPRRIASPSLHKQIAA